MVKEKKEKENPIVEITAISGAFTVAISALVLVFAKNYAWILIFVVATMGFFALMLAKECKNY
jgi:membrane glycosyltransferase